MGVTYAPDQAVEVWLAGWERWYPGVVTQAGRLGGADCVAVLFPDRPCAAVYRLDQVRPWREGRGDLQTAREPLGGLFGQEAA